MLQVITSSRFWVSIAIIGCATLLALKGTISGDLAIGTMSGLAAGFGVGKTWGAGAKLKAIPAVSVEEGGNSASADDGGEG